MLAALKADRADEAKAVRTYGQHAEEGRESGHPGIAKKLTHIRGEERQHHAILNRSIKRLRSSSSRKSGR